MPPLLAMGLKQPLYLLTTSNFFPSLKCCNSHPTSTPHCSAAASSTRPPFDRNRQRCRNYATLNQEHTASAHDFIPWPEPKRPFIPPTPYEIFNQKPLEPYSKHRFYQLVKLYHPDRHNHLEDSEITSDPSRCSRAVALERYRLVIAANAILSDPVKRQAYDRHGWGWSMHGGSDPSQSDAQTYTYTTYHRWRTDGTSPYQWPTDQDPMYNATWEDWERWYRQQASRRNPKPSFGGPHFFTAGRDQQTVFTNNYAFISLVFLLAALGGVGQATRLNESSKSRMERTQLVNEENSKLLMKARQDALDQSENGETKEERIKRFLSQRDAYDQSEFDARALRSEDGGMCASGAVKGRDEPRFWQKPPER